MKLLLFILLFTNILLSKELSYPLKNNYTLENILNNKTWNQLLYYVNGISDVNDKNFFINNNGFKNKKEELIETINSYKTTNINDKSNVCKFPSRYYFLSNFIDFPNYKMINEQCNKLYNWEVLKETKSISFILVSGYVSNPASTFGHSFIKLNGVNSNNLFDSSVNFGALVPNDVNSFSYVLNGLTGGYEAGFSDKYFYTQDMTYSNTEFRDMWSYELNLNEYEKNLILLHLWEIIGKKFDYYFLNKNCGFKVSQILNLITKKNIVNNNEIWYLPKETFDVLEDINKTENIIKKTEYIPSNQKIFDYYYKDLTTKEQAIVKKIIKGNFNYENLTIKTLDFLLLFYKQSIIIDKENINFKTIYRNLLIERLKFDKSNNDINIDDLYSPTKNTKNQNINFGVINKNDDYGFIFGYSPFEQSELDLNYKFDDLKVLNTKLNIFKNEVEINSFDLIKIISLNNNSFRKSFSWKAHVGYRDENIKEIFGTYGIGYNFNIIDINIVPMIDLSITNTIDNYKITPNVNLLYKYKENNVKFSIGKDYDGNINNLFYNLEYQYNIDSSNALLLNHKSYNNKKTSMISYKYSF